MSSVGQFGDGSFLRQPNDDSARRSAVGELSPTISLHDEATRRSVVSSPVRLTGGEAIGIIAIDLKYPKIPGNVVNATTFDFPVVYKRIEFPIEKLFAGDPSLLGEVIRCAQELERAGARAIIGACGFFAHFQDAVADAVSVPVFLSSLVQLPMIKLGLSAGKKIAVFAADGASIDGKLLGKVGSAPDDIVVVNVGNREAFAPIRWEKTELDNGALIDDMVALSKAVVDGHPEVGAILLECSDLPPYAADIHDATGLAVFDFITLINWAHHAVVQKRYYGYL